MRRRLRFCDHDQVSTPLAARVATSTPLRRAGLERALTRSGLSIADSESETLVAVRTSDDPPTGAPIELSVSGSSVHLRLDIEVDEATWSALGQVVRELMTTTASNPSI
jgi:hypothetical protein